MPLNSLSDYAVIFLIPIGYYTYAYLRDTENPSQQNPRSRWYQRNRTILNKLQIIWTVAPLCILLFSFINGTYSLEQIALPWYVVSFFTLVGSFFYYGLISKKYFDFDIRHSGWLKSFIIGWEWAYFSTILPIIFLLANQIDFILNWHLLVWFFIKNWMFCTANAILFDIKDYPTDANNQLRTFVVSFGIKKTIYLIIIPMLLAGIASFSLFSYTMDFHLGRYLINLIPFLATILIALSLKKERKILFYLIIIDGVLLFKAICGIIGTLI